MIEIKEQKCCAKEENTCGDKPVICDHFIAVIDGATPKGEKLWNGQKGDAYVAGIIAEAIEGLNQDIIATEAIEIINQKVKEQYDDFDSLDPAERLQASIVIYSVARKEIWSFGDCKFLINDKEYQDVKKGDILLADLRAFVMECAEVSGKQIDGREQILPFLKVYPLLANTDLSFGYDVINGGVIHADHVKVYPVQTGDCVVLASDGYPKLFDTLDESETYLAKALQEDPQCTGILRGTKGIAKQGSSFDDRTYIRFTVL